MNESIEYDGWNEWAKYVLKSIDRLECNINRLETKNSTDKNILLIEITELRKDMNSLKEEVIVLNTSFKIKSSLWGAASGLIAALSVYIMSKLIG
jgi:hypothetical protein